MYDIIIIGAGPAGLTASIYARRAEKSVLILEKESFGGQITYSPLVENYPGIPSASGNEIAEIFIEQALSLGVDIELGEVTDIKRINGVNIVSASCGEYEAKAVIIAAGSKHRRLGLENEDELVGNGVSYCAVCDGAFFKDKDVAVIGGGNTALQEAVLLSKTCRSVTIIQNLPYLTGEKKISDSLYKLDNVSVILGATVKELCGSTSLRSVKIVDSDGIESELGLDGVFVAIGQTPENEPFSSVATIDDSGYIVSNESCLTDTDGVFVAGDCRTKSVRQITTATADGATAALAAVRYIDSL